MKSRLRDRNQLALVTTLVGHLVLFTFIGGWLDSPTPFANDNINLTLPYRALLVRSLHSEGGGLPFWDLYSAGGMPLVTIYSSSFLNPIVILTALSSIPPATALLFEVYVYSTLGTLGMWIWLGDKVMVLARSLIALAWANSLTNVAQLHLNIEVAVSVLMMPWLMIGLTRLQNNQVLRVAVLSGTATVVATSGYLGLAPFIVYAVLTYLAVGFLWLWFTAVQRRFLIVVPKLFGGLSVACIALVLVGGALSISLSESLLNLDAGIFLNREIDPFQTSLDWRSVATMWSTGGSETYGIFDDGGVMVSMFTPTLAIAGLSWGALMGGRRYWSSFGAGLVTLLISLSPGVPSSNLLVSVLPFLDDVRFHAFSLGITLFYMSTAAADGFRSGIPRGRRYVIALLSIVVCLLLLTFVVDQSLFDRLSITLLILVVLLLVISPLGISSGARKLVLTLVTLFTAVQIAIAPGSWSIPLVDEKLELRQISLRAINAVKSNEILPVPQFRELRFEYQERFGSTSNSHLIAGVPALQTYSPHALPSMQGVVNDERAELFRHFILTPEYAPVAYKVLSFSADRASFQVPSESSSRWITVTTPYSQGWSARTDNHEMLMVRASREQFLEVLLPADKSMFSVAYQPHHLSLLATITVLSWSLMIAAFVFGIVRCCKESNVRYREQLY